MKANSSFGGDFQQYINKYLGEIYSQNGDRYDLLTNKNSKYLFYWYNDFLTTKKIEYCIAWAESFNMREEITEKIKDFKRNWEKIQKM